MKHDKYKLIKCSRSGLYRIKALKNFSNVKKGELGGLVQSEYNLKQEGECWVYHGAKVLDNAIVWGSAIVSDHAVIKDEARVGTDSHVMHFAVVGGRSSIGQGAIIRDYATIDGSASITRAKIYGFASITDTNIFNCSIGGKTTINGKFNIDKLLYLDGVDVIESPNDFVVLKFGWGDALITRGFLRIHSHQYSFDSWLSFDDDWWERMWWNNYCDGKTFRKKMLPILAKLHDNLFR